MNPFENTLKFRGFLTEDATVPPSDGITDEAYAVLVVATVSGIWDIAINEWTARTDSHRIICPGPWFCGFTRGMRRGDYVEIEAELHEIEEVRIAQVSDEKYPIKRVTSVIQATQVRRLERPLWVVDTGDND